MSAPLYFLPGVYRQHLVQGDRLSPTVLAGRGLLGIFGDIVNLQTEVSLTELTSAGPGGTSGTLLVPLVPGAEPPVRLGYFPNHQEWHNQGDQFWLGLDKESPPRAADLVRRKLVYGYRMELGDGQQWLIPVLRRPDGSSDCPSAFGWSASGEFSTRVRGEYRELWEAMGEVVEWFLTDELLKVARADMPRIVDWCVRILAVNYRFDRLLQTHLAVIGSDDWLSLLAYAVDWFTYLELNPDAQKKTPSPALPPIEPSPASVAGNISPGAGAVIPATTA